MTRRSLVSLVFHLASSRTVVNCTRYVPSFLSTSRSRPSKVLVEAVPNARASAEASSWTAWLSKRLSASSSCRRRWYVVTIWFHSFLSLTCRRGCSCWHSPCQGRRTLSCKALKCNAWTCMRVWSFAWKLARRGSGEAERKENEPAAACPKVPCSCPPPMPVF